MTVIGGQPYGVRDLYHSLLDASWKQVIGLVTLVFLLINALFGLGYWAVGGIANADPTSFKDHFFFSIHTFGTIGYGSMYPQSTAAEILMTAEALTSLFMNAFVTGLDETLGQTIHSRTSYLPSEIRYGQRFIDVIGGNRNGKRVVDLTKFHDTMPSPLSREVMGLPPMS